MQAVTDFARRVVVIDDRLTSAENLGLFDGEKNETKVPIERIEDIYQHVDAIRATVSAYSE